MRSRHFFLSALLFSGTLTSCSHVQDNHSSRGEQRASLPSGMVAAAHPLAAEAGAQVLRESGNAFDAAVATAFTLNVVEPHASGIGGGGFVVCYLAETEEVYVLDYREVAPSGINESHYTTDGTFSSDGMSSGGKSVAVPGMVMGILQIHNLFGSVPREDLLRPAILHATEGFAVSSDLAQHISSKLPLLMEDETAQQMYLEDELFAPEEGDILRNPLLASTLQRVAVDGENGIYNQEVAEYIAAVTRDRGGMMTAEDVLSYHPEQRQPIRASYRGHEIVTMPPPSSGGLSVLLTLSILEHFDLSQFTPQSPEYLALLAKALESAQNETDKYVADPGFVEVPVAQLLEPKWADSEAKKIALALQIDERATVGARRGKVRHIEEKTENRGNTTHFSIVDKQGNMVALTQTINSFFGSGVFVPELGVILNNEMYDFTFKKGALNLPAGGKRPRSNMAPMLVVKDGKPIATLGTPGGRRIPSALVQILVRSIDFNEPLQDAVDAPRIYADSAKTRLSYEPRLSEETIAAVSEILSREKEWSFEARAEFDNFFGGAQGIWIRETAEGKKLEGAADPRRNGFVASTVEE